MKRVHSLLLILVLALAATYLAKYLLTDNLENADAEALDLRISLDKDSCLLAEDVVAHITLRNQSDHNVTVDHLVFPFPALSITDEAGNHLTPKASFPRQENLPTMELGPGDSLTETRILSTDCGYLQMNLPDADFPVTGHRWIQASYYDQVYSPPVQLTILAPTAEEQSALKMILRALVVARDGDSEGSSSIFDSLVILYPESRYLPLACDIVFAASTLDHDTSRILSYGKLIIRTIPDSEAAILGAKAIFRVLPSAASFCDSIATAYPNTRLAAHALEKLASLTSQKH